MTAVAGFGGGCHWCTEAVFQAVRGVTLVEQGFLSADAPDDTFSEGARVTYDPGAVSLEDLLAVHLATHSSGAAHRMRGKYRSAVYVVDPGQHDAATRALAVHAVRSPLVTRVLWMRAFRSSPPEVRDYYRAGPDRPFCRTYIAPKLERLRQDLPHLAEPP